MSLFKTVNPTTNREIKKFQEHTSKELENRLEKAQFGLSLNRSSAFSLRSKRMKNLAVILRENKLQYAHLITLEMGKPIKEAQSEIEKCAWLCEYYAQEARWMLQEEIIETEASKSVVCYEPLGILLAIMPWNFPFWQVFRFAVPALMAGNVVLLKHAPNVPQCALAITDAFEQARVPEGAFQNLFLSDKKIKLLIEDNRISAISLTGSTSAGSKVAATAGKHIKPAVLELGGSDPFIVLQDANVKKAANIGLKSRMLNGGQSCIAAKRFFVHESVYDNFLHFMKEGVAKLQYGNPMNENNDLGPLAREDIASNLAVQIRKSVKLGAEIVLGGQRPKRPGFYFEPTLMTAVKPGMPVFDQETFGPVVAIIKVRDEEEAIRLANQSEYGLGASIWSLDINKALRIGRLLQTGNVFINSMVKSDPRLPFGGIKKSGYGRELSHHGLKAFVNVKTVVVE